MRTTVKNLALIVATFLISFGGVAMAADAVDPGNGSFDVAKSIYDAFAGGHYAYCAALGLILGVALIKRYLGPKITWLHTDAGGATLTLAGSFGAALAASLASGGPVTFGLLESSALVAFGAAGGYAVLKKLVIEPLIKPLQGKLPLWAQPIFSIVLWIFDKPDAAAQIEATATASGDAAVKAAPAAGAAAVVGTPTEIK